MAETPSPSLKESHSNVSTPTFNESLIEGRKVQQEEETSSPMGSSGTQGGKEAGSEIDSSRDKIALEDSDYAKSSGPDCKNQAHGLAHNNIEAVDSINPYSVVKQDATVTKDSSDHHCDTNKSSLETEYSVDVKKIEDPDANHRENSATDLKTQTSRPGGMNPRGDDAKYENEIDVNIASEENVKKSSCDDSSSVATDFRSPKPDNDSDDVSSITNDFHSLKLDNELDDASSVAPDFRSPKPDNDSEANPISTTMKCTAKHVPPMQMEPAAAKPVPPEAISLFLVRKKDHVRMVRFNYKTGCYQVYVECKDTTWEKRKRELEEYLSESYQTNIQLNIQQFPAAKCGKLARLVGAPLCSLGCLQIILPGGDMQSGMITLFIENMDTKENFMLIMGHHLKGESLREKIGHDLYDQVFKGFKDPNKDMDSANEAFMKNCNCLMDEKELSINVTDGADENVILTGRKIVGFSFDDEYALCQFGVGKGETPPDGTASRFAACDAMLVKLTKPKEGSVDMGKFQIGPNADGVHPIHQIHPIPSLNEQVLQELSQDQVIVISDNHRIQVSEFDTVRHVDGDPLRIHKKTITTTTKQGRRRVCEPGQSGMAAVIQQGDGRTSLSSMGALGTTDVILQENYYHPVLQQLKKMTYLDGYDVDRIDIRYKLPSCSEQIVFREPPKLEQQDLDSGFISLASARYTSGV